MPHDLRSELERQLSIAHRALWRASQHASHDIRYDGIRSDLTNMAQRTHDIHTSVAYGPQHPGQLRIA